MTWKEMIRVERLPRTQESKRRVLFITNMWPDERRPYYGSFIASQARSLTACDVAVDVIYVRGFISPPIVYAKAMVSVPLVARREKLDYDVIHVHYGHTAVNAIGITARPLIVSFCGEDLLGAPRDNGLTMKSRIEVAAFRQIARLADATITKSSEMEQALPASIRAKNFILPNGVNTEIFRPIARRQARARLGWNEDEKIILFLGDPSNPRKRVELARAATEMVAARVQNVRLHIAWEVPPDEVPYVMNAADCLVFPSRSEGSPNAIKEAMACELPIVATPVGDVPERLNGIPNCWVRDPEPEVFADALACALLANRSPAARVAVEDLTANRVADKLLAIYDSVATVRRSNATS
jgi:teichuronic acid biosynthesis glycosyltransferase TuaC